MSTTTVFTVRFLTTRSSEWTHSRTFKAVGPAKRWAIELIAQPGILDAEVHRCTKELISLFDDVHAEVAADLAASAEVAADVASSKLDD